MDYMEYYYHIHDNNHYNKPYINRVGIDVSYQQMKTDETIPPYKTTSTRTTTTQEQIITSYMDKQKRPTTTQEKQERGK